MSFKVMADNNQSISVSQDGAMYNAFAGNQDFIIAGIGNEMRVGYNATSLSVSLGTGEAVIDGRHITAQGTNTLVLSSSQSGYLVLRYDLSLGSIVSLVSTTTLKEENLNNGGRVRDLVLGYYTTNSVGVTSFDDRRKVLSSIEPAVARTAQKLANPITLSLIGKATGNATFDGASSFNLNVTNVNADSAQTATNADTARIATKWAGALYGTTDPTDDIGNDGDVYYVIEE